MRKIKLPELLAPAGNMECLVAAVKAGADAVYFGAGAFNARARAGNFDSEALREAVRYCHSYGRKAYVTLNTAVKERELSDALSLASEIYEAGADAVICADLGLISEIRRQLPDLEVHISTQAGVRSTEGARYFASLGASRVVLARELTAREMQSVSKNCGIETEVFVHGALCVSVSGRCLFSSLVGGRSGNRGECAQPCRLPYNKGKYLLSLKDMSLANHIRELCETGTSSLKIEGRMKSASYVYGVVSIYRRLLDEYRSASAEEHSLLERIFSRNGFTSAYFTGRISPEMKGMRPEGERGVEIPQAKEPKRIPVKLFMRVKKGSPLFVSYETEDGRSSYAVGSIPVEAETRPMTPDDYLRPLSALGNTPFEVDGVEFEFDAGLMLPVSALKSARREAIEQLAAQYHPARESVRTSYKERVSPSETACITAKFYNAHSVTDRAREFFDTVFINACEYDRRLANGAFLPETASEADSEALETVLCELRSKGCERIMVSDIGELCAAARAGFSEIHTDVGFNVYNSECVKMLKSAGATRVLSSAELILPAARALDAAVTVYGRIPLMVLKKCIGRELIGCDRCKSGNGAFTLVDRKGISFPGIRDKGFYNSGHGSIIFNSLPTYVGDRKNGSLPDVHFIFTTEGKDEVERVIAAYEGGESLGMQVRRI